MSERGKQIFERLSQLREEAKKFANGGGRLSDKQRNTNETKNLLAEYRRMAEGDNPVIDNDDIDMATRFERGEYIGEEPKKHQIKRLPG